MENETLNFINCPRECLGKKAANVVLKFKWQNAQFSFGFSINPKDLVIETTSDFETCRICFTEKQLCTSLESLPHFLLCHSLPRCNLHLRVSSQTAQHWTTKAFLLFHFAVTEPRWSLVVSSDWAWGVPVLYTTPFHKHVSFAEPRFCLGIFKVPFADFVNFAHLLYRFHHVLSM